MGSIVGSMGNLNLYKLNQSLLIMIPEMAVPHILGVVSISYQSLGSIANMSLIQVGEGNLFISTR